MSIVGIIKPLQGKGNNKKDVLKMLKLPKKYNNIVKDYYKDQDGYWLILKDGYIEPDMQARTIHEESHNEIVNKLKTCKKVTG
jgi:uncharacterized protein (UPF0262 family)